MARGKSSFALLIPKYSSKHLNSILRKCFDPSSIKSMKKPLKKELETSLNSLLSRVGDENFSLDPFFHGQSKSRNCRNCQPPLKASSIYIYWLHHFENHERWRLNFLTMIDSQEAQANSYTHLLLLPRVCFTWGLEIKYRWKEVGEVIALERASLETRETK
jgi:hypothetical protein